MEVKAALKATKRNIHAAQYAVYKAWQRHQAGRVIPFDSRLALAFRMLLAKGYVMHGYRLRDIATANFAWRKDVPAQVMVQGVEVAYRYRHARPNDSLNYIIAKSFDDLYGKIGELPTVARHDNPVKRMGWWRDDGWDAYVSRAKEADMSIATQLAYTGLIPVQTELLIPESFRPMLDVAQERIEKKWQEFLTLVPARLTVTIEREKKGR